MNVPKFSEVVMARAPMVNIPINISSINGNVTILPQWWKSVTQDDFYEFVMSWGGISKGYRKAEYNPSYLSMKLSDVSSEKKWSSDQAEVIDERKRIMAFPGAEHVLICSKGIAIQSITVQGFCGIIDIDNLMPSASRNSLLKFKADELKRYLIKELMSSIVEKYEGLAFEGTIHHIYTKMIGVAMMYGSNLLLKTSIKWISIFNQDGGIGYINPNELKSVLKNTDTVILAYGKNPFLMPQIISRTYKNISSNELMLFVDSFNITYFESENELEKRPLMKNIRHWYSGDYSNRPINLLAVIGEIFNVKPLEIVESDWDCHKNDLMTKKIDRDKEVGFV